MSEVNAAGNPVGTFFQPRYLLDPSRPLTSGYIIAYPDGDDDRGYETAQDAADAAERWCDQTIGFKPESVVIAKVTVEYLLEESSRLMTG